MKAQLNTAIEETEAYIAFLKDKRPESKAALSYYRGCRSGLLAALDGLNGDLAMLEQFTGTTFIGYIREKYGDSTAQQVKKDL